MLEVPVMDVMDQALSLNREERFLLMWMLMEALTEEDHIDFHQRFGDQLQEVQSTAEEIEGRIPLGLIYSAAMVIHNEEWKTNEQRKAVNKTI